jgi:hypothetical protein
MKYTTLNARRVLPGHDRVAIGRHWDRQERHGPSADIMLGDADRERQGQNGHRVSPYGTHLKVLEAF